MTGLARPARPFAGLRTTIRYKLLALVLFPVVIALPAVLLLAVNWGRQFGYDQLYIKVNTDLSVAHDAFARIGTDYLDAIGRLAESFEFRRALDAGDEVAIRAALATLRERARYAFLHLTDRERNWLHEDRPATSRHSDVVTRALAGTPGTAVEIFSAGELALEGLSEGVRLPILDTPLARPSTRGIEDRGMMIRVAYPVRDATGRVRAVLDGGVLLNGNFRFVDAIRDLVYGKGSLPEGSIGTVTVFLDDVRISTNVPLRAGERALGTRVSQAVRDHVLGAGRTWVDRAFVVNDWYVSAYEPNFDARGERVGMLYTGFLEAPFRERLWRALALLAGLVLALMALMALLAVRGATSIFRPVEAMAGVVAATRRGEDRRIGDVRSRDEIGELARAFDKMLDLLRQRELQVRQAADELERKVQSRTAELQQRNEALARTITALRQTRRALVEAEKLAALGELTAGVAHEINNPTAVMLGNLDIIRQELGAALDPVRTEVNLVDAQIYRIRDIVDRLLQYARPAEYAGYVAETDVNRLAGESLKLVQHLLRNTAIAVRLDLQATRRIEINSQELQQVLVNLLVNAVHAVDPQRGVITVSTEDWEPRGVRLVVADNGQGIAPEHLDRIFNPFFGTKDPGKGTGLGLSISYGLMRRYGGRITATSSPGEGARFTVWLLAVPEYQEEEATIAEMMADTADDGGGTASPASPADYPASASPGRPS